MIHIKKITTTKKSKACQNKNGRGGSVGQHSHGQMSDEKVEISFISARPFHRSTTQRTEQQPSFLVMMLNKLKTKFTTISLILYLTTVHYCQKHFGGNATVASVMFIAIVFHSRKFYTAHGSHREEEVDVQKAGPWICLCTACGYLDFREFTFSVFPKTCIELLQTGNFF